MEIQRCTECFAMSSFQVLTLLRDTEPLISLSEGREGKRIEFFPPRDTRSGAAEVEEHAIYVESTICYLAGEYPRT